MYATICGGLNITFTDKDKSFLKKGGKLETKVRTQNTRLTFRLVDTIPKKFPPQHITEPNARIFFHPRDASMYKIKEVSVWIDRKAAKTLLETGCYETRGHLDRLTILYWGDKNTKYSS